MGDTENEDVEWVFYRDRPEWKDVTPVPQSEEPFPVFQIVYSAKYKDIFDYFRAVLKNREISERALELSADAASVNPADYTVWHYRRILLKELKEDLNQEMELVQYMIEDNSKVYQLWHHRKVLVEWLNDPSKEKKITGAVLSQDAKNYHAWQHRQWVIRHFNLWENELEFVTSLLEDDIRNNSAWNQRYFVIENTTGFTDDILSKEIKFTLESIKKAPHNESPWNYLRGILQDKGLSKYPEISEFTDELYNSGCRSPHLLGFIIDTIEENLLVKQDTSLCLKALDLCNSLATKHDTIRKEYWSFVARNLGDLYGPEEAHVHTSSNSN